jgi:SAM-dependent methyltransferase
VDVQGIDTLERYGFKNVFVADICEDLSMLEQPWDVIVLPEVLEHLESPGQALRQIKRIMGPDTKLLISAPNGLAYYRCPWRGKEVVHTDHLAWYSESTIRQLIERSGLQIQSIEGYCWSRVHARASRVIPWQALADGLLIVARSNDRSS